MSEELYRVFNDYDEMMAFKDENGGTWGSCHDSKGFSIKGSYYVKYKPKPLKREYMIYNIRPGKAEPSIALGDYEGKRIWGGEMLNEFIGEKVKITIEVIQED